MFIKLYQTIHNCTNNHYTIYIKLHCAALFQPYNGMYQARPHMPGTELMGWGKANKGIPHTDNYVNPSSIFMIRQLIHRFS